ncbi:hypothetical protein FOZ63_002558 [Perkinsus olseni]|uniref:Uncharacterized protein n=1 Tax=Perkinsus olseni TaxID=32597 RepID=A0A7J6PBU8_PEROL|nr:hypothetical protein FOZ60_010346 [Perkinsus olseni]KAF4709022.1 hypothetical protein FOZ63_002558 [Perkinsus olseni]
MSTWERTLRPSPSSQSLLARAAGFCVAGRRTPLPEYDPLTDHNLHHYWRSPTTRAHLHEMGFIADDGSLISLDQYRRKLHVIEGDMHRAEQLRERRACREEQLQADQVAWRKIEVAKEKRAQEIRDRKAEILAAREAAKRKREGPL